MTPAPWRWVRSSRCSPSGDNCVAVGLGQPLVGVRDTKAGDRPPLTFPPARWLAFLARVTTAGPHPRR
ncbi:MAG TPA: DUF397 domain-containing protein [Actinophytocola sp.]|jgi:hypothetical protein|uniref:DUF397 domain-containing protein n=1 Tax=Actinophytocola sp. TaxID=1872138 RepID=UPI002E071D7E|nr:DUF397 domain-containing protein [Actinophytocola sp.]